MRTIDQSVFCQLPPRFLRKLCLIKLPPLSIFIPLSLWILKEFNTQTVFSSLIEKWKQIKQNKGHGAALIMDLSKAFDTIHHELLLAKLQAYGFTRESLLILFSYFSDHWQHVKTDSSFNSWSKLTQEFPQEAVLGPFLFNIYFKWFIFCS